MKKQVTKGYLEAPWRLLGGACQFTMCVAAPGGGIATLALLLGGLWEPVAVMWAILIAWAAILCRMVGSRPRCLWPDFPHDVEYRHLGIGHWNTNIRMKYWSGWSDALDDYMTKRVNGVEGDAPQIEFPVSGELGMDGVYAYYKEGPGDKLWMEERDRNYILRLEREGRLLEVEPNADKEIITWCWQRNHIFEREIKQALQRARATSTENEIAHATREIAHEENEIARETSEIPHEESEIAREEHNLPRSLLNLREKAELEQRKARLRLRKARLEQRKTELKQRKASLEQKKAILKRIKMDLEEEHTDLAQSLAVPNGAGPASAAPFHAAGATPLAIIPATPYAAGPADDRRAQEEAERRTWEADQQRQLLDQRAKLTNNLQNPQPIPIRQPRTPQQPIGSDYVREPDGGNPAGGDPVEPRKVMRHDGVVKLSFKIHYNELTFIKILGKGAFGEVWQGKYNDEDVAIKKLFVAHMSELTEQAFLREAGIMATLDGQYVMRLRKVVLAPDPYCMVMDYMPQGSLHSLLHSNTEIPWATRWQLAMDIGHGLTYLHRKEILHHDLKSENVLLGAGLRAKLADFGLSKVKTETTGTVTSNLPTGSVRWLPPEAFRRGFKYTYSSDVYSYGLVLWEIATRKLPFEDGANMEIIKDWIKSGETENFPNKNECPEEYAVTGKTCWHKNPDARPTAAQVVERLKALEEPLKQFGLFRQPAGPAEDPAEYAEAPVPGGR